MILSKAWNRAVPLCLMERDRKPSCFRTLARSSPAQGPSKKAAAVPRLPPRFGSKQSFSLAGSGSLRPESKGNERPAVDGSTAGEKVHLVSSM